jgi:2-polyprenyl-3-methyl-5-hydroxy-6-metoxy-1,4-benzoquinol methylase
MIQCMFCKGRNFENIQKIKTKLIVDLYKRELNIDIASEFGQNQFINTFKCNDCELIFFNPIITGSEQFYENLQLQESGYYSNKRPEYIEAIKHINKNDKVLEIGAGSAYFAEILGNINYVGLEYNQEAIDKAKTKGIKLKKDSIEEFSQNNAEQFDVVCAFHVLEHVSNPYTFIESSLKTLKKGGKFICAVPCSDSFSISYHNHILNLPPHHVTRWSLKTFKYSCEKFDLKIETLYVEKIVNPKDHFEIKSRTLFFNFIFPNKKIVLNKNFLKIFHKFFKKLNRTLGLYKSDTLEKYHGKSMMLIAVKK